MKRAFHLRSVALAAFACAVLAGCVNLAPEYTAPASPVPQALPSSGVEAPTPVDVGWRSFFVDPKLQGTIELALANNRDLRVAALNIERARAQYGIARAGLFPTVDAGAGGSRSRTPGSLSSSGEARIASQYSADLGLTSYELDLFGRVRNLNEAALQSYFQTEATQRSTQISLVASVATAWLQLAADEQRLQLARSTLDSQRKSFELIERSHRLGAQSGLALAQAQSTVDAARADAAAFDSQVEQARNALALLVGATPPAELMPVIPALDTGEPATAAQLLVPPAGPALQRAAAAPRRAGRRARAAREPCRHRRGARRVLSAHRAHGLGGHGEQHAVGPVRERQQGVELCAVGQRADLRRRRQPREPGGGAGAAEDPGRHL
jgi:multidrug efflux system outer membrane protein